MSKRIFVIYPKVKEKPAEMLFAKTELEGKELDFEQVEKDLKQIISIFEKLEETSSKYHVEDAKLTIGVLRMKQAPSGLVFSTNFLSMIKGKIDAELAEKLSGNNLIEITIKRIAT